MTRTLLVRLVEAVERFPDRPAVVPRGRVVTYAQLGRMVAAASRRIGTGVKGGGRVALLSDNSPEYVASVYGSWAAGLGVVGLNPALRTGELEGLVRHAEVGALILDPDHPVADRLREGLAEHLPVHSMTALTEPDTGGTSDLPDASPRGSESLATIVYTSGTTGHPKGVMLSHANLAANTEAIQASLPIEADDRALCVLPFQYSYGASIVHTHLTLGATVLLERSLAYPHRTLERAEEEAATSLAGVPSTFYILLERTELDRYDLSSLRYVTQAGGRMDPLQIDRIRSALPGTRFIVMYGQTEASARLTCLPAEDLDRKRGSAGRAIPGVELQARHENGRPCAPGEPGEIWARGANVMQGYWRDPAATAQVLSDGWLRTGDLGHLDADGYLFLEGRAREMIKSGAYRIAPVEIEEVIRRVEGVRDVAVTGRDDALLGEAIHAFVETAEPGKDLERRILRACVERLARYKMPKDIHFTSELPRTASGKVRKHLL